MAARAGSGERQPERGKPVVEGGVVAGREGAEGPERASGADRGDGSRHAPGSCALGPSRAPLPASSSAHFGGSDGLPSLVRFLGRVSPTPWRATLPYGVLTRVRMPDVTGASTGCQRTYPRTDRPHRRKPGIESAAAARPRSTTSRGSVRRARGSGRPALPRWRGADRRTRSADRRSAPPARRFDFVVGRQGPGHAVGPALGRWPASGVERVRLESRARIARSTARSSSRISSAARPGPGPRRGRR